jgi:putative addiction module component (TIGR02574 family)
MTTKAAKVLRDAIRLPAADRADIASCLYGTLDDEVIAELDKSWEKEIRRRLKDLEGGKVKRVSRATALKQIFADG